MSHPETTDYTVILTGVVSPHAAEGTPKPPTGTGHTPSEAMAFFAAKNTTLQNDYLNETGEYAESCSLIALRLVKFLTHEGHSPRILTLFGEEITENGWIHKAPLLPIPYEGRVRWGAHVVCEAAGVVYDPMLDRPLPLADYLKAAFNQAVIIDDRLHL